MANTIQTGRSKAILKELEDEFHTFRDSETESGYLISLGIERAIQIFKERYNSLLK